MLSVKHTLKHIIKYHSKKKTSKISLIIDINKLIFNKSTVNKKWKPAYHDLKGHIDRY